METDKRKSKPQCDAHWDGHRCHRDAGHDGQHSARSGEDKVAWESVQEGEHE